MVPYFTQDGITLYHGDYASVLAELPVLGATLVLVDPPYGCTSLSWDKNSDYNWLYSIERHIRPETSLWCFGAMSNFLSAGALFTRAGWRYAQDVVWQKHNGSSFQKDRFRRVHEHLVQFCRTDSKWADVYKDVQYTMDAKAKTVHRRTSSSHTGKISGGEYKSVEGGPRMMLSVLAVKSCHGYAQHPTQKPLGILDPVIRYSCSASGLVLDPMMGSGSTLVAARDAGRYAVGIEKDERYCEIAANRLLKQNTI
jgi:site-specific DNA-methyltransferase (adenine-specific)